MYPQAPPLPHPDICQAAPEKSDAAPENAAFSEEGEEEESLAEDVLVEPDAAEAVPETLPEPETPSLTLASLAQTAEALLKQGGRGWGNPGEGLEVSVLLGLENLDLESDRTLATIYERHF